MIVSWNFQYDQIFKFIVCYKNLLFVLKFIKGKTQDRIGGVVWKQKQMRDTFFSIPATCCIFENSYTCLFRTWVNYCITYQTWNWGYFFFFQVDELIKKYEKAEAEAEAAKKDKEKIK